MSTPSLDPAPRATLERLVSTYGTKLAKRPVRVGRLLHDLTGDHGLEISLVVAAAEEGIASELVEPVNGGSTAATLADMTRRLQERRGLSETDARWAVETWAAAAPAPTTPVDDAGSPPVDEVGSSWVRPPVAAPSTEAPPPAMWPPPWAESTPPPRRLQPGAIAIAAVVALALVASAVFLLARGGDDADSTVAGGAGGGIANGDGTIATPPPADVKGRGETSSASASAVTLTWQPPEGAYPDRYVVSRDGVEVGTTAGLSLTDESVGWGSDPTYEVRAGYGDALSPPVTLSVRVPDPSLWDAQLTGTVHTVATVVGGDSPLPSELGYQQASAWSFTPACAGPSCSVRLHDRHFGWSTALHRHNHNFEGSVTGRFQSVCGRSTPTLSRLQISIEPTGAGTVDGTWAVTTFTGTVHETFVDCVGSFDYTIDGT
jgi:hypothetical protein